MTKLDYDLLLEASKAGGPSALSDVTSLAPAGGFHSLVAPAKYTNNGRATYVFERRFIDGEPLNTVLIDSRTSSANRMEEAIAQAIEEGQHTLVNMPRIMVSYEADDGRIIQEADYQLPHRAFDAHVRLGFDPESKASIVENEYYIAARNADTSNAWDLLQISPMTILFGGWDSTRKSRQARFASCVNAEIIGVLADQERDPGMLASRRSGARIDPIGAGIYFSRSDADAIAKRVGQETSKKRKKGDSVSGSEFVIGAIPPQTGESAALDGIAVRKVIRSRVLNFATLRAVRFGKGAEADQAIRALLAAIAVVAMTRSDAELHLRAGAHLVEQEAPAIMLYKRFGEEMPLDPMRVEEAEALLDEAYVRADEVAGLGWNGKPFEVKGDPAVIQGVNDAEDGD